MHFEHKLTIKSMLKNYLEQKGINTKENFKCLNNCDGARSKTMGFKNDMIRCFRCGIRFDIFDLIGKEYNLNTFREQYQQACIIFKLEDEFNKYKYKETAKNVKNSVVEERNQEDLNKDRYNTFYEKLTDKRKELIKVLNVLENRNSREYQEIKFNIDFIDRFTNQILEYNGKSLQLINDFKKIYELEYTAFKKYYLDLN